MRLSQSLSRSGGAGRSNSKTLVQQEVNSKLRQMKNLGSAMDEENDHRTPAIPERSPPPFPRPGVVSGGETFLGSLPTGRPNISPHSDVELPNASPNEGDSFAATFGDAPLAGGGDHLTYLTADGEAIEIDPGPSLDEDLELAASLNA